MGLVKTCMLLVLFSMAETVATAQMQRPSPNYGEQSTFDFELRRWRADLISELRLSIPGAIGSDFDPVLALGLPQQRIFDFHFGVRLTRKIKFRANWFRVRYAADTIVFEDLTISGTTFPTGTTLTSFLELEQRRGGIQYDFLSGQYGYLAVAAEWARFRAKTDFSSPGAAVSAEFSPKAAKAGAIVIDNTSHFRMDPDVPLVVPEVNPQAISGHTRKGIIANPNCSTIQMVVALKPLHDLASTGSHPESRSAARRSGRR